MHDFKQIGVKIKELINVSAMNSDLLRKIDPETVKNISSLNSKADKLLRTVNSLQLYFDLILKIAKTALNNPNVKSRNYNQIKNYNLRINRLCEKADKAVIQLKSEMSVFALDYANIEKKNSALTTIVGSMQNFLDNIFSVLEELTVEAEEVYHRIKTLNELTEKPEMMAGFNKN